MRIQHITGISVYLCDLLSSLIFRCILSAEIMKLCAHLISDLVFTLLR